MFVSFRNGVVLYQYTGGNPNQPSFLSKTSGGTYYVSLLTNDKDFAASFSHNQAEYLKTFYNNVNNAWGPFNDVNTHYLYIDIDTLTAEVTYGSTLVAPMYGNSLPVAPTTDQNFFDVINSRALVWNGSSWIPKIRVFVGEVDSSIVTPYIGTVTGSYSPYTSGPIIYSGTGRGILKHDKTFLTLSEKFFIDNIAFGSSSFEQASIPVKAGNNLAANRFVKINHDSTLIYAEPSDVGVNLIFVLTEPLDIGEVTYLCVGGVIQNNTWNWNNAGLDLYVGENGVISLTDPSISNNLLPSKPPIGKTLSSTSIIVNPVMFLGNVGSTYVPPILDGGLSWQLITSNTTATAFSGYVVDISGGNVDITLPLTPSVNDEIVISVDTDINSTINVCTILPNGNNIKGQTDSVVIDINNLTIRLIWLGGTLGWALV
ncbi:MAG: hypothetical protein KDH96_03380 [Candidatus Riesia sp.]|nr:hypothetical protein [Candidatus Riesia sp.]